MQTNRAINPIRIIAFVRAFCEYFECRGYQKEVVVMLIAISIKMVTTTSRRQIAVWRVGFCRWTYRTARVPNAIDPTRTIYQGKLGMRTKTPVKIAKPRVRSLLSSDQKYDAPTRKQTHIAVTHNPLMGLSALAMTVVLITMYVSSIAA